jgi:hypothetical protein
MDAKRERELEEQYIRGYLDYPETPEEEEWATQASLDALAETPGMMKRKQRRPDLKNNEDACGAP